MRETKAKGVAFGTGILIAGAVALFATLQQSGAATAGPAPAPEPPVQPGPEGPAQPGPTEPTQPRAAEPAAPTAPVQDSVILAGRAVYEAQSCAVCHSIAGEGSPRSPLDGVGSRLEADEIRLWIVDPQAARPGVRKPAFDDLPEGDVDALVAYLQTLTE